MSERRIVILTDGRTNPMNAKTASCVIRYKPEEVVALLDTTQPGKTSQELLGVGGAIPVVANLADAPGANTLLIGIAPSRRQAAAGVAKDLARSDRSRHEPRFRPARFSLERSGDRRRGRQARRGDSRRPQEQRARRRQSPEPARRLPADSHRRPGLLGRQDAGLGRDRARPQGARLRCEVRRHRPDRHHDRRRRLPGRLRRVRLRERRGREAGARQSASRYSARSKARARCRIRAIRR